MSYGALRGMATGAVRVVGDVGGLDGRAPEDDGRGEAHALGQDDGYQGEDQQLAGAALVAAQPRAAAATADTAAAATTAAASG